MVNKDLVIILLVIALVGISAFSFGYIFLSPDDNNKINNNTTINKTNQIKNNTSTSNVTKKKSSKSKGLNLEGYTLVDVRTGTPGDVYCTVCGELTVSRTVYEYINDENDRIMIGENYCHNCGRITSKDYWQDGQWHNL